MYGFIERVIIRVCSIFPRLAERLNKRLTISEKQRKEIQDILNEYTKKEESVSKYNLRGNILPTLSNVIALKVMYEIEEPNEDDINKILQEEVVEDLKKLGLDDLLPQLRQGVSEEIQRRKAEKLKEEMQQAQLEIAEKYAQGDTQQVQAPGEDILEIK